MKPRKNGQCCKKSWRARSERVRSEMTGFEPATCQCNTDVRDGPAADFVDDDRPRPREHQGERVAPQVHARAVPQRPSHQQPAVLGPLLANPMFAAVAVALKLQHAAVGVELVPITELD